jgi:hypothetical protein
MHCIQDSGGLECDRHKHEFEASNRSPGENLSKWLRRFDTLSASGSQKTCRLIRM